MEIKIRDLNDPLDYTGDQLHSLFNYEKTGVKGDSLYAFIGNMDVKTNHMVDMEDVIENDFIWSPKAVNFVIEIFHIGIETAVLYQRAFMQICADTLRVLIGLTSSEDRVRLKGDDILIQRHGAASRKLSVSIATVSHVSGLIHAGLNMETDTEIPVPAIGLKDLGLSDLEIEGFIKLITLEFRNFVEQVKLAAVKVKGV